MADPQGFLRTRERELPTRRPVPVRIRDWKEVYEEQDTAVLQRQAGRCMDCGIPFCHSGCPLGNLIPEWNDLAWRGDWRSAIERLHATNNFPEFTGRLCPAPCETACVLGINQPAVTIKQVEVTTIERAFEAQGVQPLPPERLTSKTVAVVGSGPAGLAVAQQLTRAGHTVAVYERADRPGGLLRYGIPEFKMEKAILDRRLAQMQAEGTIFRSGVDVGGDITGQQLQARFDAVVLAVGSTLPRDLLVPGREFDGVVQAMDFLPQANRVAVGDQVEDQITAAGKDVPMQSAPARCPVGDQPGDHAPARSRPTRQSAVADLPDDLPHRLRPRGGRRTAVRREHQRDPRGRRRQGPWPSPARGSDGGVGFREGRGYRA